MRKRSYVGAFARTLGIMAALCFCAIGVASTASYGYDGDVVFADFNGDDYGDWTVEGEAFGTKPAPGTLPNQMHVSGFLGEGLVNSFYGGDASTGALTSPEFEIEKPFINFLIGGGGVPGLSFDLIVDGEAVRSAAGPNINPGGSEELDWATWDVSELQGQKAFLRVVDNATGGWGHINVDEITFSDKKRAGAAHIREVEITAQYLQFAINQRAPQHWIRIEVDGEIVREFTAALALVSDEKTSADFDACVDMGPWVGKKCVFIVEKALEETEFAPLTFTDELYGGVKGYDEKYRPRFHFSPRYGWTNDPNGLTFYNGEYHLFHQHNPFGTQWGNMTWGHLKSPDLLHWTDMGDALYPDPLGTIFSGSGAVDFNNTTGFQQDPNLPPFVVMYTADGPTMRYGNNVSQCLAYSVDGGKTFQKFADNPTIPHIIGGNRDPKIFWHSPSEQWVAALYLDGEDYALFGSKDLKSWEELCRIENLGCSECPDIFELPVDGDEENTMWVFWGGNGKYLLGQFDGKNFERSSEPLDAKWGGNDYAAQSFSDTPGRRIQFSWMNGGNYPGMPFNQQFSIPRELTLRTTPDGVRLCINPVVEVESLRENALHLVAIPNEAGEFTWCAPNCDDQNYNLLDYELTLEPQGGAITVETRGHKIVLDPDAGTITHDGVVAPLAAIEGKIKLRVLLDVTSIEIFVNDGLSQIAKCFVPEDENEAPILRVENAKSYSCQCFPMADVWK